MEKAQFAIDFPILNFVDPNRFEFCDDWRVVLVQQQSEAEADRAREAEREAQRKVVAQEKRRLAADGYTWPTMADDNQWDFKKDMSVWRHMPNFKAKAVAPKL